MIQIVKPEPLKWLDTGCGTGTLVKKAGKVFPDTCFTLADPSEAMLDIARTKLVTANVDGYIVAGTQELALADDRFDVITAILAHHYLNEAARRAAITNSYRLLRTAGIYINLETIMPATEQGKQIGLDWWRAAQIRQGKSEENAAKHISRFGQELSPIPIKSHIDFFMTLVFQWWKCSGFPACRLDYMP